MLWKFREGGKKTQLGQHRPCMEWGEHCCRQGGKGEKRGHKHREDQGLDPLGGKSADSQTAGPFHEPPSEDFSGRCSVLNSRGNIGSKRGRTTRKFSRGFETVSHGSEHDLCGRGGWRDGPRGWRVSVTPKAGKGGVAKCKAALPVWPW